MGIERKVLKRIRNYKAYEDAKQIDYDENGNAIVTIGLKRVEDFYSPVCYRTYEMINKDVVEFIDENQRQIPIDKDINLDIFIEKRTTNEEKKRIRDTVKRQSAEDIVGLKKRYRGKLVSGIMFFLLGALLLLIGLLFNGEDSGSIFIETLVIIAWVFEWDAIEALVFDTHNIKQKLIRKFQLLNAKVHVRQYSKTIIRQYDIDMDEETEE